MNLGTARILIIVALVAAGAIVLANGFEDQPETAGATPSETSSPSASGATPTSPATASPTDEPPQTPSPATEGVAIVVLNGTGVQGLAALAQDMLISEGYVAPTVPGNAPQTGVEVTTVYYRAGDDAAQNKADATYISETFFEGSKVDKLGTTFDDLVVDSVTVAIVVGEDYAESVSA